jgi:hypothetical protein
VDLDIVNLYFRSRETKDYLEAHGVQVITPQGKWSAADLPAISPAILGVLQNQATHVVFDVGGDDVGATALGRFRKDFIEGQYEMFFVVNTCRPFTRSEEGVIKIFHEVQAASRLKVTALVSNTNLGDETTPEVILEGYRLVSQVAAELNLSIALVGVEVGLVDNINSVLAKDKLLVIKRFMRPPWYEENGLILTDPNSNFNRYHSSNQKGGLD